ncbi:MAG: hypothetical protein CVV22_12245 [Ignavibacteriae bacterium HGW-Ignavibacteriae-1]|jgi:S1-C subfamily serine protease|nr:MAG: hypothetical protein CVV22_12245 [Ignavibacteriae bacterium HGW-Ignavibacteriae-1]
MKIILYVVVVFSFLFVTGCASTLAPRNQEIVIKSDNPAIKVTIDTAFVGEGKDVKTWVVKDFHVKQIVAEADGYKKEYAILLQDHRSYWHIMSWIPFVVVGAPWADYGPKSYFYDDSVFVYNNYKYPKWDSTQKRFFFKNISFDVKKDENRINFYYYSDYIKKKGPHTISNSDSLKYTSTIFENLIYDVLKKTEYIDTTNTVFFDNLNTLNLRCKVTNLDINEVTRYYGGNKVKHLVKSTIYQSVVKGTWTIEDIYGDTLHVEPFTSESGLFSQDLYKTEKAVINSMNDALEASLITVMNSTDVQKLRKFDTATTMQFDLLSVKRPAKKPTNIEEAMMATVTIKTSDSHGSGFLINNEGYLITNHHVINKKKKYIVLTSDGKEYEAKIIRSNNVLDLALLKIEGDFDFAFEIPESKNYRIGQSLFAIGTPKSIDLGQSVSKGVVSNNRKYRNYNYIQSDVSINRGNSGGPMVSENGDLISVVEWKMLGIGTEGISFSIPAEDIKTALGLSY